VTIDNTWPGTREGSNDQWAPSRPVPSPPAVAFFTLHTINPVSQTQPRGSYAVTRKHRRQAHRSMISCFFLNPLPHPLAFPRGNGGDRTRRRPCTCHVHVEKRKKKLPASTTHSDASGYGVTYLYGLQLSTGSLLFNLLHGTYDVLPGKQTSGGDASSLHLFSKQRDRTTKAKPCTCAGAMCTYVRPFPPFLHPHVSPGPGGWVVAGKLSL
jgi:hypothetical protein